MTNVVTIGETMAALTGSETGPLRHSKAMTLSIGGSESNLAIALVRQGVGATWIGRVGSDSLGDLIVRELQAEGVRPLVVRDTEAATGLMIKERRSAGMTQVWYYRAGLAGSRLTVDDVDFSYVRNANLLHVTGISPALSGTMSLVIDEAISEANAAGVPVSFDLNFRAQLWSREEAQATYQRIIPHATLVFATASEATIALGTTATPEQLARGLLGMGAREAIVKLGPAGAVSAHGDHIYKQLAVEVPVVDTVGAGDGFAAGYLAEYLAGESVEKRLETAAVTGAYVCMNISGWEGLPRRDELETLGARDPVTR